MSDPPTDSEFFELTRDQIKHEDSLINNRMTWLLSLQAFLFAGYGFSLSAESNINSAKLLKPEIDITSIQQVIDTARAGFAWMTFLSSIVLLCGIAAAADSMLNLVRQWNKRVEDKKIAKTSYPQIIGAAIPILRVWGGLLPTYALPVASSVVWLFLAYDRPWVRLAFCCCSLCCRWHRHPRAFSVQKAFPAPSPFEAVICHRRLGRPLIPVCSRSG